MKKPLAGIREDEPARGKGWLTLLEKAATPLASGVAGIIASRISTSR